MTVVGDLSAQLMRDAKQCKLVSSRVDQLDELAESLYSWAKSVGIALPEPQTLAERIRELRDPVVHSVDSSIGRCVQALEDGVVGPVRQRDGHVTVGAVFTLFGELAKETAQNVSCRAKKVIVGTVDRILPAQGKEDCIEGTPGQCDWTSIAGVVVSRSKSKMTLIASPKLEKARSFSRELLPVDVVSSVDRAIAFAPPFAKQVRANVGVALEQTVEAGREGFEYVGKVPPTQMPMELAYMSLRAVGLLESNDDFDKAKTTLGKLLDAYMRVLSLSAPKE